jgi:hypothetical protein
MGESEHVHEDEHVHGNEHVHEPVPRDTCTCTTAYSGITIIEVSPASA